MTAGFEPLPAREQGPLPALPYDRWPDVNGEDALLFCRLADGFLLRFPDRADFVVTPETGTVRCTPAPGASEQMVTALYLNQVRPLMLNHAGTMVLHAAAINHGGSALAFAGPSGRGKSTLAAAFAAAGHPFLTDDGLILEPAEGGYLACPSHASVRLWLDSELAIFDREATQAEEDRTEKSRLVSDRRLPHQPDPIPLRAIYFLGEGDCERVAVARLSPREGLAALIQHAFVLDVEDRARVRRHFGRLAELSEIVPLFALDFPRDYDGLPRVISAILAHARQGEPSS